MRGAQTMNERDVEEAKAVIEEAYGLIEEEDSLISITEEGLIKGIAKALHRARLEGAERMRAMAFKVADECVLGNGDISDEIAVRIKSIDAENVLNEM